jgi:hypothetical protein
MATNTIWIPFRPKASLPHSADGRPAQVVEVTLRRLFVPRSEQIAHAIWAGININCR